MKALIAEDDESSRQYLETILRYVGYEVVSCCNGLEAWNYLQTASVEVIISDILMPQMDGYDLCRNVRQLEQHKNTPFIFYTATYTDARDERLGLSMGADHFAIKPMPHEDFIYMLNEVVERVSQNNSAHPGEEFEQIYLEHLHAERVREKLDQKVHELELAQSNLIESEQRFRDYAESSADWFWESDEELNVKIVTGGERLPQLKNLNLLAEACFSDSPKQMQAHISQHKNLNDFIVELPDTDGVSRYYRLSGKPVFNQQNAFRGYRGVGRDVTETIRLNRQVEYLATHDELTALPNRNMFHQRLDQVVAKAERNGTQALLLFFDLDNFKLINDTLGHEAGDRLLIEASVRIAGCIRASDAFCRLGGDEFVLILEEASPQEGHRLVRDIIAAFSSPFMINQQPVYITVSIGISVYPNDTTDAQTLLNYADLAMYRAKQNGRNDFSFYTSELNTVAHEWLAIEQGLRQALQTNQLFMVYQPQVNMQTGELVGLEALVRWQHPTRGLIMPGEFIAVAEQSSLIIALGEWVIEQVCYQINKWQSHDIAIPCISINLSARHLRSPSLRETLATIPKLYQVMPEQLCIEITEHVLLEDTQVVRNNMEYIRSKGYPLSLDDFGMGHSSLVYLKRYAVNQLKIDRSFVKNMDIKDGDQAIAKAIIAMGNAFGLALMGEGVENPLQAQVLMENGCQFAQGFHFAYPMNANELEAWIVMQNLDAKASNQDPNFTT